MRNLMPSLVPPCKDCDKKGCGTYHDQCEPYQEFLRNQKALREKLNAEKRRRDSHRQF